MTTVTAKLNHRAALRKQKEEATIKYSKASEQAYILEQKVYEFGREFTQKENQIKDENRRGEISEYEKNILDKYQKQYDQYNQELKSAEKEKSDLNELIRKLHDEIEGSYGQLQAEEARAHAQTIEDVEAEIVRLQKLIAEQESLMATAADAVTPLNELTQSRENMLAEIATGDTKETQLKTLDEQIKEARKTAESAKYKTERATQTITGLQRKLDIETAHLIELKQQWNDVIIDVLTSEAELLGHEYAVVSKEVSIIFTRLIALDRLLSRYNNKPRRLLMNNWDEMCLPSFRLKALEGHSYTNENSLLFSVSRSSNDFDTAVEAQVERLSNAGIQL